GPFRGLLRTGHALHALAVLHTVALHTLHALAHLHAVHHLHAGVLRMHRHTVHVLLHRHVLRPGGCSRQNRGQCRQQDGAQQNGTCIHGLISSGRNACRLLCLRIRWRSSRRNAAGITSMDRTGAVSMPPTIGAAMRRTSSEPAPPPSMIGSRPATTTATVIAIGRTRNNAPSRMASSSAAWVSSPASRRRCQAWRRYSTITTPNSAVRPARAMKPITTATDTA